jgi:hypothetical protein
VSIVMLAVAAVIPVTVSDGTEQRNTNLWLALTLGVLLTILFYVLLSLGLQFAGVDDDAPVIAQGLASEPEQQRLLQRWLERARWARFVGGFAGVLAWFLGTQAHGDLLVLGTGGIAAGAILAELHHVRRPSGPRTARIEVRTVNDYLSRRDARLMTGVAGAAAVVAVVGVWRNDTRSATWWGIGALIALGVVRLAQQRVATRARPAVSDTLTRADDLARELAIGRGLARPATFFALALMAQGCSELEPVLGGAAGALSIAAWLCALVLWWQNRRLGLDFLKQRPPTTVIA